MQVVAKQMLHHLNVGLRALAFLRLPSDAPASGFPAVIGMVTLAVCVQAAVERTSAGSEASFDATGISSAVAAWAVFAVLVQCLRRANRPLVTANLIANCAAVTILVSAVIVAVTAFAVSPSDGENGLASAISSWVAGSWHVSVALFVAGFAVLLVPYWRIGRAATLSMPRRLGLALPVIALLPLALVPQRPMFRDGEASFTMPTIWDLAQFLPRTPSETAATPRRPSIDFEAAWARQPELVGKALAGLAPSRPGIPEAYFVGAATYAEQDVFKREVTSARAIVDQRLDTQGRSLLLVNHRDSLTEQPLANITNLEAALVGVGKIMDHDKDVLVLFLTSHGGPGVFSISFGGFGFNNLTPERLAAVLAKSGIKNRVIMLSACYSGSFLAALEHPGTLVMTAASAEKTSFGCSNEREWTYFGDALFNHALRETTDLPAAFKLAATKVAGWEKDQGLVASEPQLFVGAEIGQKLDRLQQRLMTLPKPAAAIPNLPLTPTPAVEAMATADR